MAVVVCDQVWLRHPEEQVERRLPLLLTFRTRCWLRLYEIASGCKLKVSMPHSKAMACCHTLPQALIIVFIRMWSTSRLLAAH